MNKASGMIQQILTPISDQGNAMFSKVAVYVGVSGSSIGVASGVAKTSTIDPMWLSLSDWGSICGIAGGITLVLKSGVDIYFARKKDRREEEQHELNKINTNNGDH